MFTMLHHTCPYNLLVCTNNVHNKIMQRKIMHQSRVKGRMLQAKRSTVQYIPLINRTTIEIEFYPPLDASITTVILISFLGIRVV